MDNLHHCPCHRSGCRCQMTPSPCGQDYHRSHYHDRGSDTRIDKNHHPEASSTNRSALARIKDVHSLRTYLLVRELVISAKVGRLLDIALTAAATGVPTDHSRTGRPGRPDWPGDGRSHRSRHGRRGPRGGGVVRLGAWLTPLSLPSLWLSPSGHREPEDLGWLALSTCILCGLPFWSWNKLSTSKLTNATAATTVRNQRTGAQRIALLVAVLTLRCVAASSRAFLLHLCFQG
ncbi:uncharacterized protein [Dermacentor albipictus]|uniref:uncharacterized protein isoform X4 n=1 Tax=Dermacentor albipictus TaxID=60249 RepID=UPI0038FBECC8